MTSSSSDRTLRRRLLPVLGASVITLITAAPIWFWSFSDRQTAIWSFSWLLFIFTVKGILFFLMRQRMLQPTRKLTIFGTALIDYFLALMIFCGVMDLVWITLLTLAVKLEPTPSWLTILNRAGIAGSGTFVVLTGLAVFYEMHRAGSGISVHEMTAQEVSSDRGSRL